MMAVKPLQLQACMLATYQMSVSTTLYIGEGPNLLCPDTSISLSIEIFKRMDLLVSLLGCRTSRSYLSIYYGYYRNDLILYNVTHEGRTFLLSPQELRRRPSVTADWFGLGEHLVNIAACKNVRPPWDICDSNSFPSTIELTVNITVRPNSVRLFPYGNSSRDRTLRGALDGQFEIPSPDIIPFFGGFDYQTIYVRKLYRIKLLFHVTCSMIV